MNDENEWDDPEFESAGAAFAQGAMLNQALPGPVLATAVATVAGGDVSGLTDNELLGIVSAASRAASWMAWAQTVAEAEYASRHTEWNACGQREVLTEFASQDLAQELRLSGGAARSRLDRALAARQRLPRSLALLHEGKIDEYRMRIIAETTAGVSDLVIAKADRLIAEQAAGRTPGSLRRLCLKVVMLVDPRAMEENRKRNTKGRRVEVVQEYSGNGMVSVREINPVEALTIKVNLDRWARIMRAAGLAGSLDNLRADAATALLTQRHPVTGKAQPAGQNGRADSGGKAASDRTAADDGGPWAGIQPADQDPAETAEDPEAASYDPWEFGEYGDQGVESEAASLDGESVGPVAVINIQIPEGLLDRTSGAPAQIAGFGYLGGDAARDLVAAASRNPATRWCVTKIGRHGVAVAHACIRGRHRWDAPGTGPPGTGPPGTGPPGTGPPSLMANFIRSLSPKFESLARDPGDDGHREPRHDPSRALTHLIQARNATCATPGCEASAIFADMEHTIAWEEGGHTDEHNLDPRCRHHHRLKQQKNWMVTKPAPGITQWTAPSGRTRTAQATRYLI